jgi:hypothetical protein
LREKASIVITPVRTGRANAKLARGRCASKPKLRLNYYVSWQSEVLQGLGEFINDDGSRIEGFWRENMLNGKITIKFADGSVLKSVNFNDDKAVSEHVFADGRQ